jgi:hypothetical protein
MHHQRETAARAAVEALGRSPSQHARLQISCGRGHHVAVVYDTDSGLVFRSAVRARAHGKRDQPDTGHNGSPKERVWLDLLDAHGPSVDDELPAGCECGPRTLSRHLVQGFIADGERHVVLS